MSDLIKIHLQDQRQIDALNGEINKLKKILSELRLSADKSLKVRRKDTFILVYGHHNDSCLYLNFLAVIVKSGKIFYFISIFIFTSEITEYAHTITNRQKHYPYIQVNIFSFSPTHTIILNSRNVLLYHKKNLSMCSLI